MTKEISLKQIDDRVKAHAIPDSDIVIGIGEGGIVPATLVAIRAGLPLRLISARYRGVDNVPVLDKPMVSRVPDIPDNVKTVLLVDDVSVSGKTLEEVKGSLSKYQTRTLVLKGEADVVLFPEISECVTWPWTASKN